MTTSPDLTALERHHLSEIWGDMDEPLFNALVADIREYGVREPVVLFEGKVLDGWHRIRAAIEAGLVHIPVNEFAGDDPAGFVIRRNALRRPLTTQQRVAIVAMAREWHPPGRSGEAGLAAQALVRTEKQLAEESGSSVALVQKVKQQIRAGHGTKIATGEETITSLQRKARDKASQKGATPPLTRMEKLEAENERLRVERDTTLEKLTECEEEAATHT